MHLIRSSLIGPYPVMLGVAEVLAIAAVVLISYTIIVAFRNVL